METAFIGLDYIFDIACDGGKIATSAKCVTNNNVILKANAAIEFARNNGWIVIQVKLGFSPSYIRVECPDGSPMLSGARGLDASGLYDFGTNFHKDLDVREGDIIIVKHRISVFYCTTLEADLRANKVVRLVIVGVSSAWAVQSAARDAHDRDYDVVVLEDACAAADENERDYSMRLLRKIANVIKVSELPSLELCAGNSALFLLNY